MDPPVWALPHVPDFCLGVGNPGGIANKHHVFEQFPVGWWHLTETQASKYQQCSFQKHLKSISFRQDRILRSVMGHPAPLRSGSQIAGSWTGVLSFGDCTIRQVPCVWPSGAYASGRVDLSIAYICGLEIAAATIYCPPKGPTCPQAKEVSEALLAPITEQLVFGRSGPRAILGDFSCSSGSLIAMKHWISQGWVELQSWLHQVHGIEPKCTCKGATSPDQLWISPELLPFVMNGSVWNIFPDHGVLIAGLKIPTLRFTELQWRLPGRIPWASLDTEAWDHLSEISPLVPSSSQHEGCTLYEETSSEAFHRWSRDFERRASSAMISPVAKSDRSYHGRAKLCKPVRSRINAVVLKQTRPGELAQSNGFLNRATARWFKQLRRIQSYHHAVHSERATENYASRLVLWSSIRRAVGFENGFETWWISRPYPMPGSPTIFPPFPPNSTVATIILEDFTQNYRRFEYWQHERRLQSCRRKVQESAKGIFSITRRPSKPPLDHLEDDITQEITVVDGAKGLIRVPESYPQDSVHRWTLQGTPAWVWQEGPLYRVETDLLLLDGQQLSCKVTIQDEAVIHSRLAQLRSPRWNKHEEVPDSHWNQIIDFARTHLPQDSFELPDISVADWEKAVHQFKTTAASGPCGWSREDLLNLTTHQIQQVLDFFSALEQGASWPDQMSVGLIHCLQKRDNVLSADGFRPITVTSMFYRVYAGIRAGQLLAILSRSASFMQCGFLKGHQASDIWYFVGICVEVSLQTSTPVYGCVADIVKAYNCLPRFPVFETLRTLGTPTWLLSLWSRHLSSFTRYFVVRRSCGMPLGSVTGFAEGCPLSCVAMCAIGHLWHRWQAYHSSQALPLSFVDNFELISARLPALHQGMSSLREFCSALDISIDESCLYHWSTSAEGRKDFRERGLKVSSGSRDLGGQVDYTAQLRNRVLTNRINDTFQWYQKLRSSKASVAIKISNIQQVLFPRGLHGCEAIQLGVTHLQRLRSQVMKALRWDRAGASPIIRLSLMHADIDPHWYQLWHCVQQFRRQFHHNSAVQDWWKMFCDSFKGSSNGPFGKLVDLLSSLGLNLTSDGRLWFSSNGYVIPQAASDSLVRRILLWAHHNSFATQIQHREDFGDLDGCDVEITQSADVELVQIARDGAFVTNKQRSKFDARKRARCLHCGSSDTLEHRYKTCPHYSPVRQQFPELVAQWPSLPDSFSIHGLVPANPWTPLVWEALLAIEDTTDKFSFPPGNSVLHCFTDGSCSDPVSCTDALASWAVVVPGQGTLACGHLQGIQQNIARAEITAVLCSLKWGYRHWGSLHIWSDSQNTVDHFRELQTGCASYEDFEHSDLWKQISFLLQKAIATITIHKVAAHDSESSCTSPLEEWCWRYNSLADKQAGITNMQRPLYFERIWRGFQSFRTIWKQRVKWQVAFQLAVANWDVEAVESEVEVDSEKENDNVQFFVSGEPNEALIAFHFRSLASHQIVFSGSQNSLFRSLCVQLRDWVIAVDEEAPTMRQVSLLEIYVMFRVSLPGRFPLLSGGVQPSLFDSYTFASDFSFFKKIWRFLFRWAHLEWTNGTVNLQHVHILNPQASLLLGWSFDVTACKLLKDFVGNRPVQTSQALAKPWQP